MTTLQTLDRGLQALLMIANAREGMSVADIASRLEVDRAIAYRIVATLEARGLVSRRNGGQLFLAAGILNFEGRFESHFRRLAKPHLEKLAKDTMATSFLSVAEGNECVTIDVSQPDTSKLTVGYQLGSRHSINEGAIGIAILSGRPAAPADSDEVNEARRLGYSATSGVLQKGAVGMAMPLDRVERSTGYFEACVGVFAMDELDVPKTAPVVQECATVLSSLLT